MNSGERITFAIEQSGQKPSAVAKVCGVSRSAVSQWMAGNTKSLKPENLFGVAVATGFSAQWLGTGDGPMRPGGESGAEEQTAGTTSGGANARRIIEAVTALDGEGRLPDALADAILAMLKTAPARGESPKPEASVPGAGVIKRHTTAEAIATVDMQANRDQLVEHKNRSIRLMRNHKKNGAHEDTEVSKKQ